MDFKPFDARHYPTLPVDEGYGEWARTYDTVVQDEMDLRLLARLDVDWAAAARALDLACGTGRIGQWLRAQGVATLEGLDFTPAMLAKARARGVYDRLLKGDVRATGLPEAVPPSELPAGTQEGINDWKRTGYGGPCPPIGRHRYFFKLYALDTGLALQQPTKAELVKAMDGHILAEAVLMGTYQKRGSKD